MNGLEKKFLLWELKILFKKASTMKLNWSTFFQALTAAGTAGTWALNVVPSNWKPFVSLGLGIISLVLHWHAGQVNPDGTPASVAYVPSKNNFTGGSSLKLLAFAFILILALAVAVPMHAQNAPIPTMPFSFTANALALPSGTSFAGTDAGITYSPTQNFTISDHNILSGDGLLNYFGGGVDYTFQPVSLNINNSAPSMSGFRLLFSAGGSLGQARVNLASGTVAHWGEELHGSVSYALSSSGTWQLAFRAGAGRFPYYHNGWMPIIQCGPSFHF